MIKCNFCKEEFSINVLDLHKERCSKNPKNIKVEEKKTEDAKKVTENEDKVTKKQDEETEDTKKVTENKKAK